jgi:hypothetical protein
VGNYQGSCALSLQIYKKSEGDNIESSLSCPFTHITSGSSYHTSTVTGSTRKSGTTSAGNHYHEMENGITGSDNHLPPIPNSNELGWAMVGSETSLALPGYAVC